MIRDKYSDVAVVHLYLDEITTFIESIVEDEKVAITLACGIFEKHKNLCRIAPFKTESERLLWLRLHAREVATAHNLAKKEAIKEKAIKAAIHDFEKLHS